jgi:uncharacterized protein YkwD
MKNIICFFISFILFAVLPIQGVFAASETETAAAYLAAHGIYKGDESGSLNLDKGLTRADLAVILTRLEFVSLYGGLAEWESWGEKQFSSPENRYSSFTDVPVWAAAYVEYCYQMSLMKGQTSTLFDPHSMAGPKAACTVMLRYAGYPETDWEYNTSVQKAIATGLAPDEGMDGDIILRSAMAVMFYRSINKEKSKAVSGDNTKVVDSYPAPNQETGSALLARVTASPNEMRAEVVRLTNEERAKAGLPSLIVLPELMNSAQAKAQDMIDTGYYGHYSPTYGISHNIISSFVPEVNGGWENITRGPIPTAEDAVQTWMESDGHRAAILESSTTHIGVGVTFDDDGRYYWVQQFIKL